MYQALYRKYRPQNFNEVVGQKIIVKTLINAIKTNKISHAYLFAGPRGTGKTSIAKIFAKTINCKNLNNVTPCENCDSCLSFNSKKDIDMIEIDAASNNGVDEIRNLKNSVNFVPNNSKYKVYIIDEVHMLSTSAFNALLKTLEEPPEFVIFILATTELYKVPETIISRCQNFEFRRISISDMSSRLLQICEKENILIDNDAINEISKISNGGMRDAIGLLDQLSAYTTKKITIDDINDVCGFISNEHLFEMMSLIIDNNLDEVLTKINKYNDEGKDLTIILKKIAEQLKNVLIYINASEYFDDKNLIEKYEYFANKIAEKKINKMINEITESLKNMKYENDKLFLSQLCIIRIFNVIGSNTISMDNKQDEIIKNFKNSIDSNYPKIKNEKQLVKKESTKIIQFKKIRINNTLAQFNKRDLLEFKQELNKLHSYISNSKFASTISIILDGIVKAKGNEYVIFVYSDKKMSTYFNEKINDIENTLFFILKQKYKVISVCVDEWEIIKNDFNNSLKMGEKKYVLMDEVAMIDDKSQNNDIKINDIDNSFNEIVKYI